MSELTEFAANFTRGLVEAGRKMGELCVEVAEAMGFRD